MDDNQRAYQWELDTLASFSRSLAGTPDSDVFVGSTAPTPPAGLGPPSQAAASLLRIQQMHVTARSAEAPPFLGLGLPLAGAQSGLPSPPFYTSDDVDPPKVVTSRRSQPSVRVGLRGVVYSATQGSWKAAIYHGGTLQELGYFPSEAEAGKAYDAKARELHGARARLNFPSTGERTAAGKSPYRGISFQPRCGKWEVRLKHQGTMRYLGIFLSEEEAAKQWDVASLRLRGPAAATSLNFPAATPSLISRCLEDGSWAAWEPSRLQCELAKVQRALCPDPAAGASSSLGSSARAAAVGQGAAKPSKRKQRVSALRLDGAFGAHSDELAASAAGDMLGPSSSSRADKTPRRAYSQSPSTATESSGVAGYGSKQQAFDTPAPAFQHSAASAFASVGGHLNDSVGATPGARQKKRMVTRPHAPPPVSSQGSSAMPACSISTSPADVSAGLGHASAGPDFGFYGGAYPSPGGFSTLSSYAASGWAFPVGSPTNSVVSTGSLPDQLQMLASPTTSGGSLPPPTPLSTSSSTGGLAGRLDSVLRLYNAMVELNVPVSGELKAVLGSLMETTQSPFGSGVVFNKASTGSESPSAASRERQHGSTGAGAGSQSRGDAPLNNHHTTASVETSVAGSSSLSLSSLCSQTTQGSSVGAQSAMDQAPAQAQSSGAPATAWDLSLLPTYSSLSGSSAASMASSHTDLRSCAPQLHICHDLSGGAGSAAAALQAARVRWITTSPSCSSHSAEAAFGGSVFRGGTVSAAGKVPPSQLYTTGSEQEAHALTGSRMHFYQ